MKAKKKKGKITTIGTFNDEFRCKTVYLMEIEFEEEPPFKLGKCEVIR